MQGRATTLIDVANLALTILGEVPITTITPYADTEAGKKLMRMLYVSIDEVQRCFYWHELIESAEITVDGTDFHDGRKRYALPANCLRPLGVRFVSDNPLDQTAYTKIVAHESEYDYDIEGNFLITSQATDVEIVYIKRSDDPTEWTSELLECVYHAAAAKAAQAITQDSGITRNAIEIYEAMVKPYAKRLQSKYKTNATFLPTRFSNFQIHRG